MFPGPRKSLASSHCRAEAKRRPRSPADVATRLDRLIEDIRRRFHGPALEASDGSTAAKDVLLVAHGHILRAFAMRWVGKKLEEGPALLLETGGVGTLR